MKNIVTLFFCFLSFNLMSQVDFKKHAINSNVLSLMNPYYTSITLGYEFRPFEKFGVEFTYGHIFPKQKLYRESNFSIFEGEGAVYRVEPKFYFSTIEKIEEISSLFVSLKLYHTDNSFISQRSIEDTDDYTQFHVNQKIKGVIPTIGINHAMDNSFFLETSVGFGRRWITAVNDYKGDEGLLESCWGEPHADLERNGKIAKWRININVKVGVAF